MINFASVFVFFIFPMSVVLLAYGAVWLHGRGAPAIPSRADFPELFQSDQPVDVERETLIARVHALMAQNPARETKVD